MWIHVNISNEVQIWACVRMLNLVFLVIFLKTVTWFQADYLVIIFQTFEFKFLHS